MRKHFAGLQSPGARYEGILQGVIYKKKNIKEMNIVKNNYMGGVKTKVLFS